MQSIPDSTAAEVREEVFSGHADDEAPLVEELADRARIPPVEIEHAVADAGDLGQGCNHVVHHHVVERHVNVEGEGHQLEDKGHEGEVGLPAGRLDELHDQDVVDQQRQERDQQLNEQVLGVDAQFGVMFFDKPAVGRVRTDQVEQFLRESMHIFVPLLLLKRNDRGVLWALFLELPVAQVTESFCTEGPVQHDDEDSVRKVHLVGPNDVHTAGQEREEDERQHRSSRKLNEQRRDLKENHGHEDEEDGADEVPSDVGLHELDDGVSK